MVQLVGRMQLEQTPVPDRTFAEKYGWVVAVLKWVVGNIGMGTGVVDDREVCFPGCEGSLSSPLVFDRAQEG